ncbi:MAG: sensor histidine kinase [Betaproteobacteria bacterium]|nr:sensor histidine kinase [Betaproteobacteria bacterium]
MVMTTLQNAWRQLFKPRLTQPVQTQAMANMFTPDLIERLSHEMRTSLTGIVGYAEFIEEGSEPAMASFTAKIIRESSQELVRSVQSFVDLYQSNVSQDQVSCNAFSAARIMFDLVQQYQVRAHQLQLSLIFNCSDEERFTKMMHALISGALLGATRGAMVVVGLSLQAKEQSVEILIQEIGGIAKLRHSQLLKQFWNEPRYVFKMQEGPGLDMALAKSLLLALGGRAVFTAVKGQGDQLHIWLPVNLTVPHNRSDHE